ncbi:uncharacterized protein CEXT_540771 [Caerostris extrusa]|uniref:Uncharacterized protein n=1 Tax=Caerostris extrusa TaxID=172846 RepID=A0AAV4XKT6_CAEEX|nr:uncharacterized protein CEXT_540771 [Caerostris extrusa]
MVSMSILFWILLKGQLATFTRKTMTVDEAKKLFHPLIIQSPKKVLKTLIEQALLRGPKEINLSQIFLYMPTVCLFEDFLVSELLCYLSKDELLDNERKNLMQVIQIIMEVSCCTMIINFDAFLEKCIIPNLSNSDNKLYFTIECLNISLKVFTEQKEIYISSSIYVSFIKSLCSKMDVSIKSGNGMLKELIVTAFYYLEKMQNPCSSIEEKINLKSDLSHFPVTTRIYVAKLLEINSYEDLTRSESEELSEELWIWCCHHKDKALFHKCILNKVLSEMDLIQILMKTLPHCSKDEWLESANLIKELLMDSNHATILSNTPWLLPKCDHQVYGIIRCFMDCYYFLHEDQQTGNLQYITNCFSNTIMNLLSTQVDEHIFLNVFLAVCHLCSVCESGVTLLSSFLLRIQQLLQLICKDKDLRGYYLKLLYHGVKYIPDFDEKNSILEKFQ